MGLYQSGQGKVRQMGIIHLMLEKDILCDTRKDQACFRQLILP